MSLQHFHTAPFALASFSLVQLGNVVAENLGGLDSDERGSENGSDSSSKDKTNTSAEKTKTDEATTQKTDTTTNNTDANTATNTGTTITTGTDTATTDKATYNQWGFTGSQKVWGDETGTVTSGSSESSSASYSTHSVKGNKTSNANRISDNITGYDGSIWKKTFFVASIIGISTCLGVL